MCELTRVQAGHIYASIITRYEFSSLKVLQCPLNPPPGGLGREPRDSIGSE